VEREKRRERSAWCGVAGVGEYVFGGRDKDKGADADTGRDVDVDVGW